MALNNSISQSLLNAMSIVANKTAEDITSDKTIKAIVKKCVSASSGLYQISYNAGYFNAYLPSGSTDIYDVGEEVFILVPQGDMTQKKFIIGRVTENEGETSSKTSSMLNDYSIIGANSVIEKTYNLENELHTTKMQPLALNSHNISDFYYCYVNPKSDTYSEAKSFSIDGYHYDSIGYPIVEIDDESFKNSAKQAEALLIRAKFKASLDTSIIGNYGLIVNIAFADKTNPQVNEDGETVYPPKVVSYVLDSAKMTGNPVKFYDYSSQYIVSAFNGENYLYIDSIIAFSEGFVNSNTSKHTDGDDVNIYIDGIEILALDEISAINGDYRLQITTPLGNTVLSGEGDELEIQAKVTYFDKDISKGTRFYWGVKDPSITSTNDKYNAKLGSGYRYLENFEDNYDIKIPANELTAAENEYLCLAVYEEDITLRTTVSLFNNNNNLDIAIESSQGTQFQFNEGAPILTCTINGRKTNYSSKFSDSSFSFVWSKVNEESGNILLNETEEQLLAAKEEELDQCAENGVSSAGRNAMQVLSYYSARISQVQDITYPDGVNGPRIQCKMKNVNNYITYSCSVYRSDVYVGYATITLQNSSEVVNNNYHIVIENGTQVFQYSESGISPTSKRSTNPIEVKELVATFYSPQGEVITPKSIQWIVPTENTLIDSPTLNLSTDAITGEKRFIGDTYPLAIKENYDSSATNNQVTAVVVHSDGTEYRQTSNLLFTKIGELGTNGTDTVVKISELLSPPENEPLTVIKESGGNGVWNDKNHSAIKNTPFLGVKLFTNNTENTGYSARWSIAGESGATSRNYEVRDSGNENNTVLLRYVNDKNKLDNRILKAEISYGGKYFYSYYGVPSIEYNYGYSYEDYPIKINRQGTLQNILYSSDGTNPTFDDKRGAQLEIKGWPQTGYLRWKAQGGADGSKPAFSLAKNPKSKEGSIELVNEASDEDFVMEAKDAIEVYTESSEGTAHSNIEQLSANIENIVNDELLSSVAKLDEISSLLDSFKSNNRDIMARNAYNTYYNLYSEMRKEVIKAQTKNAEYLNKYNKIQEIWQSEWPDVIKNLHVKDKKKYPNIQSLISAYQNGYEDRSLSHEDNPRLAPSKDDFYLNPSTDSDNLFDAYVYGIDVIEDQNWSKSEGYNNYNNILVEYTKIIASYILELCMKTKEIYDSDDELKSIYSAVDAEWFKGSTYSYDNSWSYTMGEEWLECIRECDGNFAALTESMRAIYLYYQTLVTSIHQYKISEESEILNSYAAILNGKNPQVLDKVYVVPNNTYNGKYVNNNIVATAYLSNGSEVANIYIPIIMTLNVYELAALNGWDGSAIDINEDEGYIMTPQIGAGIKDSKTNTFTGMVMGTIGNLTTKVYYDKDNNVVDEPRVDENGNKNYEYTKTTYNSEKIGLAGYANGRQSIFLDSKTGKASFGIDSSEESHEGHIVLDPSGVSKIGNWQIGNHFLYNVIDGDIEKRQDNDARNVASQYRLMVPHDKHGIILSADNPYIDIKGIPYVGDDGLRGIDYSDEYNSLNPEDSLELRLNPQNKSLFSIVQHTAGFGDESPENIYFGYSKDSDDAYVKTLINYTDYQNVPGENNENLKYYVYKLNYTLNKDGEKVYVPYYTYVDDNQSRETADAANYLVNNLSAEQIFPANGYGKSSYTVNGTSGQVYLSKNKIHFADNSDIQIVSGTDAEDSYGFVQLNNSNTFTFRERTKSNIKSQNNSKGIIDFQVNSGEANIARVRAIVDVDVQTKNLALSREDTLNFWIVALDGQDKGSTVMIAGKRPVLESHAELTIDFSLVEGKTSLAPGTYRIYYGYDTVSDFVSDYSIVVNTAIKSIYAPAQAGISEDYSINASVNIPSAAGYQYSIKGNQFYIKALSKNPTRDYVVYDGKTVDTYFVGKANAAGDIPSTIPSNMSINDGWKVRFFDSEVLVHTVKTSEFKKDKDGKPIVAKDEDGKDKVDKNGNIVYETVIITSYTRDSVPLLETQQYGFDKESFSYSNLTAECKVKVNLSSGKKVSKLSPRDTSFYCSDGDTVESGLQAIPLARTILKNGANYITIYRDYYLQEMEKQPSEREQLGYIVLVKNNGIYYKYVRTLKWQNAKAIFESQDALSYFDSHDGESYNKDNLDLTGLIYHGDRQDNKWIVSAIEGYETAIGFKDAVYWKELLKVGIDENGRFFTNGAANRKTYSRIGKLFAYGKTPDLYGQEIRTQTRETATSPSEMSSVIKMLTQNTNTSTAKTSYISAGKDDKNNISIRSADSGYVELGASEASDVGGTIPNVDTFVRVSYAGSKSNDIFGGIHLKAQDSSLKLNDESILGSTTNLEFDIDTIKQSMADSYSIIKSPTMTLSSDDWTSGSAFSDDIENRTGGHYRISASAKGGNPEIELKLAKDKESQASIQLVNNKLQIENVVEKQKNEILLSKNGLKLANNSNANLTLQGNSFKLSNNLGSYLKAELTTSNDKSLSMASGGGSSITLINGNIKFVSGQTEISGKTVLKGEAYMDDVAFVGKQIQIGKHKEGGVTTGDLYLYRSDGNWARLSYDLLMNVYSQVNGRVAFYDVSGNTVNFHQSTVSLSSYANGR